MPTKSSLTREDVAYNEPYLSLLPDGEILELMRRQSVAFGALPSTAAQIPGDWAYAPGKWTIREVTAHLTHAERILGYRAFRFAHGDETPLAGFEEGDYVAASAANARSLAKVVAELIHLREANLSLFSSLTDVRWSRIGTANESPVSVRALVFAIVGHAAHHLTILRDRYEVPLELWPAG